MFTHHRNVTAALAHAHTLALVLAAAVACADGSTDERPGAPEAPPPPPGVASAPTDTVPLETLLLWDAEAAQQALQSDGLASQVLRSELSYAGLSNGVALQVAGTEVHLFFYGDIGAVDRVYRQFDARQLRPVRPTAVDRPKPRVLINNNMLAILDGGDDASRTRIWRSLTPGSEDVDPGAVEP